MEIEREEYVKTLQLLGKISETFSEDSHEFKAIELAAKALAFANDQALEEKFRIFLEKFYDQLTESELKKLKEFGIE